MKRLVRNLLPFLSLLSLSAYAQTNTPISTAPRVQQAGRLDYVTVGASFRTTNGNDTARCTIKTGTTTTFTGSNANGNAEVVGNAATVVAADRSAVQIVPEGSTIRSAYLYWAASQNTDAVASADNQVNFTVNGTAYAVTADRVWTGANSNGGSMGAVANVTSAFSSVAAANSTLRMDGLDIQVNGEQCGNATVHGSWALYIVYANSGLSSKLISFYDGLEYIGGTAGIPNKTVTASGFSVPNASSLDRVSKVSAMVVEGDYNATGDSLALQSNLNTSATVQSSVSRDVTNFFGGVISSEAEDGTETRQAGSVNTASSVTGGLDVATISSPTNVIPAGTSSIAVTIDSAAGELLIAHSLVLMANTSNSNVRLVKALEGTNTTFTNGDSFRYVLTLDNRQGTYEALNVVTTDTLPIGLTYNSTEISYDGGTTWSALAGVTTSGNGTTSATTITFPAVRRIDNDGKVWGGTNAIATQLGTQDVRYRLTVTANGSAFGNLTNTATAVNGGAEANTADNTGSRDVTIVSPYNLTVSKTDGQTSVVTGGSTTYTVRVTNSGTANTAGATLRDPAATGLTVTGVTCSVALGNTCTAAPTTAQIQGTPGVALPTLAPGAFYEVQLTATVTAAAGTNVTNTATAALATGQNDAVPGDNTASDTNSVTATVAPPAPNATSYPAATCDVLNWRANTNLVRTAVGLSGNYTVNSPKGVPITGTFTPAPEAGNGIVGWNDGFTNYGSWYEVRAVSASLAPGSAPTYGGAFVSRAGGSDSANTITVNFPYPVINVRFGVTDLDAIGGDNSIDRGDWLRVTATYGTATFSPDVLIADGHALPVRGYATTTAAPGTAAAGAVMNQAIAGRGNSRMGAGGAAGTLNTLMGIATATNLPAEDNDSERVDDPTTAAVETVRRQGQGVVYFKGPLTSITIVTGSKKTSSGNAIGFGNIAFCPPSVAVDKAAGTPVRQADSSYDIPYTLTYRNTSPNVGYHPDATVRDATFSPSIPTPTGADPWARQRPQLTDAVLDQIRANTNVAAATLRGTPTVSGATNTVNLDNTDLNPAFTGTAANPNLLLANTDGRVDVGGSFNVGFTVNARLGSAVTTAQTVNNQATATASLYTGSLTATSNTVASSLTPGAALSVSKVADQALIRYPLASGASKLRYTITVTNTSGLTATGVQLTDTLPASLPYAASESGNTPPTTRNGQTLTWSLGDLAPNASRSVVVFVDVPTESSLQAAAGTPQTAIVNTANAQATNSPASSGAVPVNTLYTRLFKQVRNLGPQGTLTPAWASSVNGRPGDVLEYCIDVANLGSTSLASYQVSDVVPANTLLVANSASLRQGRMDNPGAAVPGVTVADTATTDAAGRPTRLLQTSTLTLAPGAQVVLCFRATIR